MCLPLADSTASCSSARIRFTNLLDGPVPHQHREGDAPLPLLHLLRSTEFQRFVRSQQYRNAQLKTPGEAFEGNDNRPDSTYGRQNSSSCVCVSPRCRFIERAPPLFQKKFNTPPDFCSGKDPKERS